MGHRVFRALLVAGGLAAAGPAAPAQTAQLVAERGEGAHLPPPPGFETIPAAPPAPPCPPPNPACPPAPCPPRVIVRIPPPQVEFQTVPAAACPTYPPAPAHHRLLGKHHAPAPCVTCAPAAPTTTVMMVAQPAAVAPTQVMTYAPAPVQTQMVAVQPAAVQMQPVQMQQVQYQPVTVAQPAAVQMQPVQVQPVTVAVRTSAVLVLFGFWSL